MTIAYLDGAAASPPGRRYKNDLLTALDVRPGQVVVDVGCGPATDLLTIAGRVGDGGAVIGVDHDAAMVERARRRTAGHPGVEVRAGDAHALPIDSGSADRARMDRVLQHVTDPARAVAELRRVVRTGGRVALADPDWDTLIVDDPDTTVSRAYTCYVSERVVRNGAIGRQLPRLLAGAGFTVESVTAVPVVFRDYASADAILRLPVVAERAWRAGAIDEDAARAWLDRLATGFRLAAFTLLMATGSAR